VNHPPFSRLAHSPQLERIFVTFQGKILSSCQRRAGCKNQPQKNGDFRSPPQKNVLMSCIPNSLQFVAPKMHQGEARGGRKRHMCPSSNEALGHFRRNPQGRSSFRLPLRCSLLTDLCGYARRSSPRGSRKSLAANCKLFGIHDTRADPGLQPSLPKRH